jgi:hypothetical protein
VTPVVITDPVMVYGFGIDRAELQESQDGSADGELVAATPPAQ